MRHGASTGSIGARQQQAVKIQPCATAGRAAHRSRIATNALRTTSEPCVAWPATAVQPRMPALVARPHAPLAQQQERGALLVPSAMFDTLSASLSSAFKSLNADAKLTAENMKGPLRDVRRALLEADVSLPVVRRFIKKVEERALGLEVLEGVTPQVQFVKIVSDELVQLMGAEGSKDLNPGQPQVILMAGLQGVGKTTACGKLAAFLKKRRKSVLMVATDVYRPAAIDQLVKLGSKVDVPVFELGTAVSPVEIARQGVAKAKAEGIDVVIVDTAGRLQVDENLMAELQNIKAAVHPTDTLLVVDAMTGQEAASLVKTFNDQVDLSGAILTKMDGDSRGGAALSVREVSGKPIKFVGTGEKMDALEPFYPERMAQRILGMGDMLTLYEKAQEAIKEDEVAAFQKRLEADAFDFNDFLDQFKRMNNMGGLQMLKLMPGFSGVSEKQLYEVEKKLKRYEGMITSMTEEERANPQLLISSPSRRRRVAEGSGRSEQDVAELMGAFTQMKAQTSQMSKIMKLGQGGADAERQMKELIKSAQRPVAAGKVRRKKVDAGAKRAGPLDKSKGFASSKTR
uniref:signal-recognition-particle GTPase n=2 Tax=Tetradesmus obliquus TaxID=3088 RepID=A0A383VIM9_TETOB|eukprot:jgi/Sobl393_1/8361/SZX64689.1